MSEATVAERYARAIFELSTETGQDLVRPIQAFADVYKGSRELRSVLDNPLIERSKRDAVLEEVAARVGLRGPALNAIRLLADRRTLRALPEIARRLSRLADRHAGVVRATVASAVRLPDFVYQRIEQELSNAIGRRILLGRREDPALIGADVARIGDNIIDGSIRGRLAEVERRLLAQRA